MSSFHQVVVAAAPGDAVTTSALVYRELLRSVGPSEIFARYIDPRLAGDVIPLEVLRARRPGPGDELLLHASIGDPVVFPFVESRSEPLSMVFHNITPGAHFDAWDPPFAHELRSGRDQVAALKDRVRRTITPSRYNAEELVGLGYERDRVRVVPLVVELVAGGAEEEATSDGGHDPTVVFVGQQYPHKRVELLIQAAHVLATYLVPRARLVVIGTSRLPAYRDSLVALIERLRAPVEMAGAVSDAELARRLHDADVFATASDHEGFCVPVLEAMAAGTPVIAHDRGALAETIGPAGLILPPDAGPVLIAEAIAEVLIDAELRAELVAAGRARVLDLDPETARAAFLAALLE